MKSSFDQFLYSFLTRLFVFEDLSKEYKNRYLTKRMIWNIEDFWQSSQILIEDSSPDFAIPN